jgi:hypothetical protein
LNSPWDSSVRASSPDGTKTASIARASEVAMGAPTSGELRLSTGPTLESCNPSIVWSDDSRFLAVPQWTPSRSQRLVVVDTETGQVRAHPATFRVLQLESFEEGTIKGIDSPVYLPVPVVLSVRTLFP